jgi:thiamine biosynthesis lipoprotein
VIDTTFRAMGCDVRLLIDGPAAVAERERAFVEGYARRLTRFDDASELCALNSDPRPQVPASPLLSTAVAAGLWAAERTGGLVDPTLVDELERAGYERSREGAVRAPLEDALAGAPPRRAARPSEYAAWRSVAVDSGAGTIRRPPGVRLDTGGTGKGLAADAVAHRLSDRKSFPVDSGGDIAVGGTANAPIDVAVRHPLSGEIVHHVRLASGGVATSGIDARVWRRPDGSFAHHLIDPATGEPAWTGLVAVTAVAASALEAETLSKQALLSGPSAAPALLRYHHGGVLFHDDGRMEVV